MISVYDCMSPREDGNSDSEVMTLRSALQEVEKGGMVDFTLGGHMCQRPPEVAQGKADDHFSVTPDGASALLWRPNQIPAKNLKSANVASHFSFDHLNSSPLALVP